jgi:hypothetical protein
MEKRRREGEEKVKKDEGEGERTQRRRGKGKREGGNAWSKGEGKEVCERNISAGHVML